MENKPRASNVENSHMSQWFLGHNAYNFVEHDQNMSHFLRRRMCVIPEYVDLADLRMSTTQIRSPPLDGINELALSITQHGLIQPLMVRIKANYYEIVAGHRRYMACRSLGLKKLPCQVVELDDRQAFEISLVENIERKSLSPIEQANAFKIYICEYGWGGMSELALKIGKSRTYVSRRIELLALPKDVIKSIKDDFLKPTVAEELFSIKNREEQSNLARLVVQRRLSIKNLRKLKKEDPSLAFKDSSFTDSSNGIEQAYDRAILTLKIAARKLGKAIEDIRDSWFSFDLLIQHKIMVDRIIDSLMRQRKKMTLSTRVSRYSANLGGIR